MRRLLAFCLGLLLPVCASAQTTTTVTTEVELRSAISAATSGDTIVLGANISLTADLPAIATDLTFNGAGHTLSGNNQFRGLVVGDLSSGSPNSLSVTIQNVSIVDALARGGNGGSGSQGGGGGAGMGGGLFVAAFANVTLSNVSIANAKAIGGNGGAGGVAGVDNGGGGGLGGDGGNGAVGSSGGGGGAGAGAVGGSNSAGGTGSWTGAPAGGDAGGGQTGGATGGGGGADGGGAGGGGAAGGGSGSGSGGFGGYGGGGGGATSSSAGAGGFGGGGGGGLNGTGGYGGGGGGTFNTTPSSGGVGGGFGGNSPTAGGGGGAGLGGAIFVDDGGTITIAGGLTINGNTVAAGAGGAGGASGADGQGAGSGLFFAGFGTVTFAPESGVTQTVNDVIADEAGIGGNGSSSVRKSGDGTLVLNGVNTYSGGTVVSGGTLRVASSESLGTGTVSLRDGTLDVTQTGTFAHNVVVDGTGTFNASAGSTVTLSGTISESICDCFPPVFSGIAVTGGGTVVLTNEANRFGGGVAISGGSEVVVTADGALGFASGAVTLGNTTSRGTLGFGTGSALTSVRDVVVAAGGGAIDTQGTADITLSGVISGTGILTKTGAGNLTLTGNNTYSSGTVVSDGSLTAGSTNVFGTGSMRVDAPGTLNLNDFDQSVGSLAGSGSVALGTATLVTGTDNTNATFAGTIDGSGALVKVGTGTQTLTGSNSYTGGTTISGGILAGNTQSLQGTIVDNAQLRFDQAVDGVFSGAISGTGSLTKAGAGTLVLNSVNTYTGGTTVSGGALQGDTTTLQGDILNDATVIFNQLSDGTYAGAMTGSGVLVKAGGATLTLTGNNHLTGGAAILAGTLVGDAASLGGTIVNNSNLVFDQNSTGEFGGSISGTGALFKSGSGTLTLTGTSAYTGGTFISAGTLVGSTQNLQGSIANDAQLVFAQNVDGLFTGSIGGSGTVTKTGAGTLFLNGANSYTGGTFVSGGTLVGDTSSLQGSIVNNAAVNFAQNANGTYAGNMSGSGTLFKTGAGVLTLSGSSSYTGGTVIAGGSIALAQDAALGAANGGVSLGDALSAGTMTFANGALLSSLRAFTLGAGGGIFNTTGAQVTIAGDIAGSGGLTKTGAGVLELAHTNSYTGPTVVLDGTLRAGATNAFGNGGTLLLSGGSVDLNGFSQSLSAFSGTGSLFLGGGTLTTGLNNASSAFAGSISGSGSLVKTGSGSLFLTGNNNYSGGTSVLGGALVGSTSSLQGNILNNGVVQFDQNNAGTYSGSMSGSGILFKSGSGLLTLTGTNTYTGGTVIQGGSILAGASSLSGPVLNNGSFFLGGAGNGTFNGVIGGTGTLTKTGTGTVTMNGLQPLTGLTSVAQGTLVLNGGTVGSVDVASGAALNATGVVGGSLTLGGSLFALPGSSSAAAQLQSVDAGRNALTGSPFLTIAGDFTATSGSTLSFDVAPGPTPTVLVGGRALINGVHFALTAPAIGSQRSSTFIALEAVKGLTFTNSDVTVNQQNVESLLKQTQDSLYVTLLNLNIPLSIDGGTQNKAVADAIDRTKFGASGDAQKVVHELTALDQAGLQDALEQLAGELHASVLHTAILDAETVTDSVRDELASREMEIGNDFQWWGETMCQRADFKPSNHARGGTANICSGAGGGDQRLSEKWTIGFGGSWTDGSMGLGNLGKGDYTAPRALGYAGFKPSTLGFRFGGSAARSNYNTKRQIQFQARLPQDLGGLPLDDGIDRGAEAEQKGNTSDQWGEVHDSREVGSYTIEGNFGMRHARISRASFIENGAQSISLDGQDETLHLTQTDIKGKFWRRSGQFRPFGDFNYRRELAEDGTQAAVRFDGLPQSDFIVEGINIPTSTYSVRGGMTFAMWLGQATVTYEYKRAEGQKRQTVGFRMRFK